MSGVQGLLDLRSRLDRGEPVVGIGLMSGTSADGIDAAAVRIDREQGRVRPRLLAAVTVPYSPALRADLFRCFANQATPRELCLLHARLGELFADAAERVLQEIPGTRPDFAASHGQTAWHEPASPDSAPPGGGAAPAVGDLAGSRGTLQLGEAARIAARLSVPVVCDFRQQDMALGGQGAPLVPYVDYLLLAHPHRHRAVQNLGGIGNVTYLPAGGGPEAVVAFDTGPGNAWIDAAAHLVTGGRQQCDLDGALAATGPVDPGLLAELMREPYLHQAPPKSTGRELFGARRVQALWDAGHRGPGLVSTLTQLTVESMVLAYRRWLGPVDEVLVGGGGSRNPEILRRLSAALPNVGIDTHEAAGIDSEAKEALAFTILGYETLRERPSNLPSATGATRAAVQGKICLP